MVQPAGSTFPASFTTFGDLLKYLRRRERLTQLELSINVGYSEAQISRLEKNQRLPDPTSVSALFIPALHLEGDPQLSARLLELALSARQADVPAPGIAPYKGLLFFDESDSELFFGRDILTAQLVRHVMDLALDANTRFLAVVGASGSGKSSLVRAGLAVALRRIGWEVLVFTPTVKPLQMLEARLNTARQENPERVLILVDQFEEVFTLCRDELERINFIDKLFSYAQEKTKKISVVIALRADFYSHCAQYPLLRQAVAAEQEYIGQMTLEELRKAIEGPARLGGWEFEPGLVDVLLQDLSTHGSHEPEPGALPLLSHALLSTWESRRGHMLTLDGYYASGGVRGAIAETAESVFTDQLNQAQQQIARDVFLRLTELGEGTEDTRRRAALNELARQFAEAPQLRAVLNTLAEARLITLNEDSAEVAHEALIREWQRLREWLAQDREGLLLHRHLTESAQDWERRERDAADLYRGARLAQVNEWAAANSGRLNQAERDFLAASIDQEQHEAVEREAQRQRELESAKSLAAAERQRVEEQRQATHRLRRRAIYLGFSLVATFLLLLAAIAFAQRAQQQARLANAHEMAAAALNNLEVDQERSILLAMQAVKTADIPEAENALHKAVLAVRLRDTLSGHSEPLYGVALAPNSALGVARLATASQDGTIKIWELDETGMKVKKTPLVTISNPTDFEIFANASGETLALSSDRKRLAAIGPTNTAKIWDADNGKLLYTLSGHSDWIFGLTFSPNDEILATGSKDKTVKIWDTRTGHELQTLIGYTTDVGPIVFSRDGQYLASGEAQTGKVTVWERVKEPTMPASSVRFDQSYSIESQFGGVFAIAFSPDGKQMAIGSFGIKVFEIDSTMAAAPARLLLNIPAHENPVNGLFYSPDGKHLISGSSDGSAKVWDAETGQALFTLVGNAGPITSMVQSSDGELMFTAHYSGQVKVWDLSIKGNQEWLTIPNIGVGFQSRTGNRMVNLNSDPNHPEFQILELSPEGAHEISSISLNHASGSTTVDNYPSFDVDQRLSRLAAIYPNDSIIHVWDLGTGRELSSFPITKTLSETGHATKDFINLKISPDGTSLFTGGSDGSAFLWDVLSGKLLQSLPGHKDLYGGWDSLAFSPDGTWVATANYDGSLRIWSANSGALLQELPGHTGPFSNACFSTDGKRLLATGEGSKINLWDVQTGQLLITLPEYPTLVDNLAISPDGRYLGAAMLDGTAHLYDATTGQELLTLPGFFIKFTGDGKHLLAWNNGDILNGYILDINDLMALARTRLTRSWTRDECSKFLHTETCPPAP